MITLIPLLICSPLQGSANTGTIFKVEGTAQQPFGLSPDKYLNYDKDGFYLDGYSKPAAVPYILPGPADSWAGSRRHTDTFYFGLGTPDAQAKFELDLKFKDAQNTIPPKLKIAINGHELEPLYACAAGGGDQSLTGDFSKGLRQEFQIDIPVADLKAGNNKIEVTTAKGSWAIWDSIELDGPNAERANLQPEFLIGPCTSQPVVLRTKNGPRQPLDVQVLNIGDPSQGHLELQIDGKTVDETTSNIQPGVNSVELLAPWSQKDRVVNIICRTPATTSNLDANLPGVKQWTVELFPHAHLDVGYTNPQAVVSEIHRRNLLLALKLHDQYKDNPKGSQYHYNFEGTWILQQFLKLNTPAQIAQVKAGLQDGILECNAAEANELTGIMHDEEMMESYRLGIVTGEKFGVHFPVATQTDVPGVTWGTVSALSEAGIKALVLMPNPSDRLGDVNRDWQDKPFWWISEDGRHKVLVWQTVTYGMAHGIRPWNGERDHIFTTDHPTERFIGSYVLPRIAQLDAEHYPYRILGLPWSDTDNSPIDGDVPIAAKAWNEKYVSPRVVVTNWKDGVHDLIAEYGNKLPRIRGDYSPYWEDGAGSTAKETAMNRNSAVRLAEAEALFAMISPGQYAEGPFLQAWQNVVLFSEHTWGSYNSVSQPDDSLTKAVWAGKKLFATNAHSESLVLLNKAVNGRTQGLQVKEPVPVGSGVIDIWNPTGWNRSGDVVIPASLAAGSEDAVTVPGNERCLVQHREDGDLVVRVENVPAYGAIKVRLGVNPTFSAQPRLVWAHRLVMQNSVLRVELDPTTGAVSSLIDRHSGRNLVSNGTAKLGQYYYLLGGDLKDLQTNENAQVQVLENGPLEAKVQVTSQAPGVNQLRTIYTLTVGSPTLGIEIQMDKKAVLDKESVHIAFPFNIPSGTMRVDLPWSVIIPEQDQINGANRNWLTTNHFVDISNQTSGVSVTSLDAPLIEVGGITANVMGGGYESKDWIHHLDPSQTFYSWALNNLWYTNYMAAQSGELTFRYAVTVHGSWNGDAAFKFGADAATPLLATTPSSQNHLGSLVRLEGNGAVIESIKPTPDGSGLIVRLWGASGHVSHVRLVYGRGSARYYASNMMDKLGATLPDGKVTVLGYGAATVIIKPEGSRSTASPH